MFTNSYVSVEKNRGFLTAATTATTRDPSQHYGRQRELHVNPTSAVTLGGGATLLRSGSAVAADPNVPFAEFLRNLSESLRESAKMYPLKFETDRVSRNLDPETGHTEPDSSSSEDKEKHRIEICNGNDLNEDCQRMSQEKEARTQTDKSGNDISRESAKETQKGTRRYFISDILRDEPANQMTPDSRFFSCGLPQPAQPMPDFPCYGPLVPAYCHAVYQGRNMFAPWSAYSAQSLHQAYSVWHCPRPPRMESMPRFSSIGFSSDDMQGCSGISGFSNTTSSYRCSSTVYSRNCRSQRATHLNEWSGTQNAAQRSGGAIPASKSSLHKRYTCEVCHKAFSRSNTLLTHKRIHTGDKPFTCDVCGRAFRQPGNLTRHRLTHSAYKPFVCPVCRKAFNRASNLNTHIKTHPEFCTSYRRTLMARSLHEIDDLEITP